MTFLVGEVERLLLCQLRRKCVYSTEMHTRLIHFQVSHVQMCLGFICVEKYDDNNDDNGDEEKKKEAKDELMTKTKTI